MVRANNNSKTNYVWLITVEYYFNKEMTIEMGDLLKNNCYLELSVYYDC